MRPHQVREAEQPSGKAEALAAFHQRQSSAQGNKVLLGQHHRRQRAGVPEAAACVDRDASLCRSWLHVRRVAEDHEAVQLRRAASMWHRRSVDFSKP